MKDRTISISSTGKTYSFTGWKVGWATGPTHLIRGAQAAHQFVTFATATPLQHAIAHAMTEVGPGYFDTLRAEYTERRDHLLETLRDAGLQPAIPKGAYFVLADFTPVFDGDDVAYVKSLVKERRIAAIPPSFFYPARPEEGRRLARFAFCKRMETLRLARGRITDNA
jgi:N-succinyldiaminopimelate aminotransferase